MKVKTLLLIGLLASTTVIAREHRPPPSEGGRHGPPPHALKACVGKQAGDTVTLTGRHGKSMTATCEKTPDGLAARPQRSRPKGEKPSRRGPPPEGEKPPRRGPPPAGESSADAPEKP